MGVKERRAREKENLRQVILDAAREMFVSEGYENVSMRKIADRIEYSPTTIYLHFRDKAQLLNEICDETFARLLRTFERMRRDYPDPLVCLQKSMRAYVDFALKNPSHYEVTFILAIQDQAGPGDAYQFEGSLGQKTFGHIHSLVAECMKQGKLKKERVDVVSQSIWAAGHGVAALLIMHTDFPFVDRDRLIDHMGATMLRGLRK